MSANRDPSAAIATPRESGRPLVATGALLVVALVGVGAARGRLVARLEQVTVTYDVYALPPAWVLPVLSLGHRAALADLVMTDAIVQYGIHGSEHRRFDDVGRYLDAAIELDPTFREPYKYADTFITYHPVGEPTVEQIEHARRILEKGVAERPDDGRLWFSAGQYLAFIAPTFLSDPKMIDDYKKAGARMFARGGELAPDDSSRWKALAAVGVLTREGEREAAIASLERLYAVTDDVQLKDEVYRRLSAQRSEVEAEARRKREEAFRKAWHDDLPFLSRTQMLVLGPRVSPWACVWPAASLEPARASCKPSWLAWDSEHARAGAEPSQAP